MTRLRRRRPAGIAIAAAGACVLLAVALGVVALVLDTSSNSGAQRVSTAAAVAAMLSAILTMVSTALAVRTSRNGPAVSRSTLVAPHLLSEDRLVDRAPAMDELLSGISRSRVLNCHGQRGVGKSFLLEHLADVVNGHRRPPAGHGRPTGLSVALYFDLADAAGFEKMQAQVCQAVLGDASASWPQFVERVTRTFKGRKVLLILDNANSSGVWRGLGEAAYRYLASRPDDRLVIGSIDPVVLSNLGVQHLDLPGLDLEAVTELVAVRSVEMTTDELQELYVQSNGLPLYVRLLTATGRGLAGGQGTVVADALVDQELLPELAEGTRRLLAYIALLGVIKRQIPVTDLEQCPIANLDHQLEIAERLSLVTPVSGVDNRSLKIHDLVRDAALRAAGDEVAVAAHQLMERAASRERELEAALFAMFADPTMIGPERFDEIVSPVVRSAVEARNYALLSSLHTRAHQSNAMLAFLAADQDRADLFSFARASELAGLGRYGAAQEALESSSIVRIRPGRRGTTSQLQPEMRFLQADIAHLQNRYDEAAGLFQELGDWAAAENRRGLRARCVWGHGHVLRHQGRDLDHALSRLGEATDLAYAEGQLFAQVYSITGATGIKVFLGAVPDDEESVLAEAERAIAVASRHDGYMLEVWKSQAQVACSRGDIHSAFEVIDAAIERALVSNDRLLYNLYFERAEYRRLTQRWTGAIEDYERVLRFGQGNGDRNLVSNALLGLVGVDLACGRWLHHQSPDTARATVVRARDIAAGADINATVDAAQRLVPQIDEPPERRAAPGRLILF